MLIKYVGPFLTVVAGGITFTRNVPVEVDDERLVKSLTSAKDHNGKPHFVTMQENLSFDAEIKESVLATSPAT